MIHFFYNINFIFQILLLILFNIYLKQYKPLLGCKILKCYNFVTINKLKKLTFFQQNKQNNIFTNYKHFIEKFKYFEYKLNY